MSIEWGKRTGKAGHTESRAQWFSLAVCVDFGDDDLVFGMRKRICKLFIRRGQILSPMSAKEEGRSYTQELVLTLQCPLQQWFRSGQ
jgi:hypothetical protein